MKSFFILIITLLFSTLVHSQGSYLERGQSALGVGTGFTTNEDLTGIGGSIGYSVSGIFDFIFGVQRYNYDQKLLDDDLNATIISPNIVFYVSKQNEEYPWSIAINAGYDWQLYSNDVLESNDLNMTGGYFSIGGSLFGHFMLSKSAMIQPSIALSYVTGKVKLTDGYNNIKEVETKGTSILGFGVGIAFNTSSHNIFTLTPYLRFNEDKASFGLGLSLIFKTNKFAYNPTASTMRALCSF